MGIFNRLGREVEEFKQSAKQAAEEGRDYRCEACDARFSTDYEECPDCGAEAVVAATDDE
ncbi:hypothetical protein [Halosimplex marinum]|uniref:hypothetical protein n=1 Tax=Halosimplex marinum TaxID=3396620 RepID=UPI003F570104